MPIFYDQENDEGGSYEAEHAGKGATPLNLGHGPTCDHCNDAVLHHAEKRMGRVMHFKMGRLESKFEKGKWR